MRVSKCDRAYLAGLIDGEGTIAVYYPSRNRLGSPRVVIAMSTEQPLLWVYETFGYVYSGPREVKVNGRTEIRYRWGTYSRRGVYLVLQGVLPYLKLKRERAEEVIRYCEGFKQQGKDV